MVIIDYIVTKRLGLEQVPIEQFIYIWSEKPESEWRCIIMLRPTAVQVEAICAYQIMVVFDNGKKCFDVEPYIKGEWYGLMGSIYVRINCII